MNSLTIAPKGSLRGTIRVPGDKSITHRALILSALSEGTAVISGYCQGEDCLHTLKALQVLGISISPVGPDQIKVEGQGLWGLREPEHPLDCGNSGTGLRLLAGVLAGQSFFSVLTGDDSLRARPMGRIANPLRLMGAQVQGRNQGQLAPLAITGTRLHGIHYRSPVSSAQVKSAVLLAGLVADGETILEEPLLSRDHTERMFRYLGVSFDVEGLCIRLKGGQSYRGKDLHVPGDLSAAAFFIVGASIVPGSLVTIEHVGLNPARTGILEILREMGANIETLNIHEEGGEPVGDLVIKSAPLHGIAIGPTQVPKMIDEFPIFCIAAAVAEGETRVGGAEELRVKETDRIHAMATELRKLGVSIEETPDGFVLPGRAKIIGGTCISHGDHRVAMAVAIAAFLGDKPTIIQNTACIDTSFPGFHDKLLELLTKSN